MKLFQVADGVRHVVAYLVQIIGLRVYDLVPSIKRESNDATMEEGEGRLMQ